MEWPFQSYLLHIRNSFLISSLILIKLQSVGQLVKTNDRQEEQTAELQISYGESDEDNISYQKQNTWDLPLNKQ